jgi:hypothetical protein
MTGGKMYIGVNTRNYPDGEIGGNLFVPIDRVFPDLNEFEWSWFFSYRVITILDLRFPIAFLFMITFEEI